MNQTRRSKHYNQKFRKERGQKVLKVFLPNFHEERENEKLSIDEMRAKLKEKGIAPARQWNEKPLYISCTGDIFDPYIPPEGDGKIISVVRSSGMKQACQTFWKDKMALRKIRNIDYEFDVPAVAQKAKEIYIESLKALASQDEDKLHDLVTERAFPEMMECVKRNTLVFDFVDILEQPRIEQIRLQDMLSKENAFAQVTVRLHTKQKLAIYDRFGRLLHGSETAVKDVLEYIVFEKHITHPHGTWRIHGKIIPEWMPPRESVRKTFHRLNVEQEFPEPPKDETPKMISNEKTGDVTLAPA